MSFRKEIEALHPATHDLAHRRWIYVPYDRFTDRVGPLTEQPAHETGIVIVESTAKALRRPYHKKKLVVLISNMRHFALEQQARGVSVLYHFSPLSHGQALLELQRDVNLPTLTCTIPAERELRLDLHHAQKSGLAIDLVDDPAWASTLADFTGAYGPFHPGKSYVMDRFYRRMRQKTGILMQGTKPLGGQFSFDAENRKAFRNQVPVPTPP
jgi:deoxyribodipyrimidine photolyase-related protein